MPDKWTREPTLILNFQTSTATTQHRQQSTSTATQHQHNTINKPPAPPPTPTKTTAACPFKTWSRPTCFGQTRQQKTAPYLLRRFCRSSYVSAFPGVEVNQLHQGLEAHEGDVLLVLIDVRDRVRVRPVTYQLESSAPSAESHWPRLHRICATYRSDDYKACT